MARDVLSLLKATNSWIDPNLVSLVNEASGDAIQDEAKHKNDLKEEDDLVIEKKSNAEKSNAEVTSADSMNDIMNVDDGQFSSLTGNRIVLKRAEHVSDDEDSGND